MNFLAHVVVSRRLPDPDPRRDLGAALPDLAPMARLRFDWEHVPAPVAEGVKCHFLTDRSFHSTAVFLRGVEWIRDELTSRGLGRGASRAVGHAGWELLLDGCLVRRTNVGDDFLAALDQADSAASALPAGHRPQWSDFVAAMSTDHWWLGYDDPLFVARRLYGRLQRSTRLAFDPREIDVVAAVLAEAKSTMESQVDGVVDAVVAEVEEQTRVADPRWRSVERGAIGGS
jgi:hypothetical protein